MLKKDTATFGKLIIAVQWALESRKVWFSNNLKLEHKIREKFGLKLE
jgi:hypothetical protein